MLCQKMKIKTEDVGKTSQLLKVKIICNIVNRLGVSQNQNNGKDVLMQFYSEMWDKALKTASNKLLYI